MHKKKSRNVCKIDKAFIFFCLLLTMLIITIQFLMIDSNYNIKANKTLQLEGSKIIASQNTKLVGFTDSRKNSLDITIKNPYTPSLPKLYLLQNGERVADFTNSHIKIKINAGDSITIDNSFYDLQIECELFPSLDLKLKNKTISVSARGKKTVRVY